MTPLKALLTQSLKRAEAARRRFLRKHAPAIDPLAADFYETRGFAQGVAAAVEAMTVPRRIPSDSLFDAGLPDPSRVGVLVSHYSPDASRKAARLALPQSGFNRRRVLDYVAERCQIEPWKGATDEEMEHGLRLKHQSLSPRRYQLVKDGWLVDSGRRRKGSSGAEATVWVLSEAGKREWEAVA